MKYRYMFLLMLLISFGTVAGLAFSPGLPMTVKYFGVSNSTGELTIIVFLVGYAIGQLLYGPLANRFGSRNAIRITAMFTALASIGGVLSHALHSFDVLLISRFILALGAGGGLTLAIAIASKLSGPEKSARTLSLLTMAFAIPPAIAVYLCGILTYNFNWSTSFYFMLAYGLKMFIISFFLPEVVLEKKVDALNLKMLYLNYKKQCSVEVIFGGLLLGVASSFVFVFSDLAPFIAINFINPNPRMYGVFNFIPMLGMVAGSCLAVVYNKIFAPPKMIKIGLAILSIGSIILMISLHRMLHHDFSLFVPMVVIYIGFSFVYGNAAAIALKNTQDKSNASALLSFINLGSAAAVVLVLKWFTIHSSLILPIVYGGLIVLGVLWFNLMLLAEKRRV